MSIMTKNANLVIGEIIRLGPATVKDCLLNFDASKPIWANKASLAKVTRENLDAFAEFLGIPPLYGEKGVKDVELKTKPRIALRIAQELKALTVPVKCAECSDMYQHNRNDLVHLRCFLCHQPSHNPSARSKCAWKLQCLREDVESIPGEVPFIAVTETWLKPYVENLQILQGWENYRVYRCDRRYRTGGGVMLLTSYDLPIDDHVELDNDSCQLLMCSSRMGMR